MPPCRLISAATQPMRRMFVSRSCLEKVRPGGQVPPDDVAVEAGDGALALLQHQVVQRAGERGLAAARQPGEEQHEALLAGPGAVAVDDRGDRLGQLALAGDAEDLARCVRRDHPLPQVVVRGRVTARRQRDRHHGGVRQRRRGREGGAQQSRCGQVLGGAGAGERQQQDGSARGVLGDPAQVRLGQRPRDRDGEGPVVVPLGDLGRGEVEPTERAELVVRQRGHRACDAGRVPRVVRRRPPRPGRAAGPRGRPARARRRPWRRRRPRAGRAG